MKWRNEIKRRDYGRHILLSVYSFYELAFEPRNFINTDMFVLRFKDA